MRRRSLIAAIASAPPAIQIGLAGCLGAPRISRETPTAESDADEQRFERCDALVVTYDQLPDLVKREVEIALADGRYEPDGRLHLADAVAVDRTYLDVDGRTYRIDVTETSGSDDDDTNDDGAGDETNADETDADGTSRLELEEATPRLDPPAEIALDNQLDGSPEIRVVVESDADGEKIVDYEETLMAGATRELGTISEFGTYVVSVAADGRSETLSCRIDETGRDVAIRLTADEFTLDQEEAEPPTCPWGEGAGASVS